MSKAGPKRSVRVGDELRAELARILTRKLSDPRLSSVQFARVEVTDDLRQARVYVRLIVGGDDERSRRDAVHALTKASGLLRTESARTLKLRFAPELRFFYDEGQDHLLRVESILDDIASERRATPPDSDDGG